MAEQPNGSPQAAGTRTHADAGSGPDHDLHVEVMAPRFPDRPRPFTLDPDSTVGAAAEQAATAFGYTSGTWSFSINGNELERSASLVAAGVKSGTKLGLVDTGGGV